MLLPPKLTTGDTIAVFSPSAPATSTAVKRFQRGKNFLESKGFQIKEGILTGKQDYYRSGSIAERAEEFNLLIHDPENWETQTRSKTTYPNQLITIQKGIAEGRLIGGNLNTMQGIWGSPFMPDINQGDILLIEDSLLDAAAIERSFSLLKINGIFERIGGLILGKHELFNDSGSGRKPYNILQEVMGEVNFPVLAQFDCCHTHPMLTMPIGCTVRLNSVNQTVAILESPVLR